MKFEGGNLFSIDFLNQTRLLELVDKLLENEIPELVNTGTHGAFASSSSKVQGEFLHNFIVEPSKNPETLWFIEKHNSMLGPSIQVEGSKASI